MVSGRILPIVCSVGAFLALLGGITWGTTGTASALADGLAFVTVLTGFVVAGFLFAEKTPLGITMGGILVFLTPAVFIAFFSPWTGSDGDFIGAAPFALTYPAVGALGVLFTGLMLVARWEDLEPRWHLWTGLALSWLAFSLFFFVAEPAVDGDGSVGGIVFAPVILAAGVFVMDLLIAKEA